MIPHAFSDEIALEILRCGNRHEVRALAQKHGISYRAAERHFYRQTPRSLRLAHEHDLPRRRAHPHYGARHWFDKIVAEEWS
jgi:hypothetical protein